MKCAPFDYVRPASVPEAVAALAAAGGEGKVLAGGQSLVPVLALRMARPAVLVDVNRVGGLPGIERAGGNVVVGALVRHRDLAAQDAHPMLAAAARHIGHTAIRTRGTAGGSLAHADPAAELPAVAVALGATVTVAGPAGERVVAADALFDGPLTTTLADDELLTSAAFPVPGRWGFAEFARRHGDFAVALAAVAEVAGGWRVALGGVGPVPVRARRAEALLDGGGGVDEVTAAVAGDLRPAGDVHGTAAYRRALAGEMVRRALAQAGRG